MIVKMYRKEALLIAFVWLLVVASSGADATAAARNLKSNDLFHPQARCRCCTFILKPMISCGRTCCGTDEENCCLKP